MQTFPLTRSPDMSSKDDVYLTINYLSYQFSNAPSILKFPIWIHNHIS